MNNKVDSLLMIPDNHLDGVIKEISCPTNVTLPSRVNMQFNYIQLQDGSTRTVDFLSILKAGIIAYCLNREEAASVDFLNASELYEEARETFVRGDHSGEVGELALYMFLESRLKAPQILSKMSLKTSGNLNYNGTDAVHIKVEDKNIMLFLGESKVYKDLSSSVDKCLESIADFYFDELVGCRTQFDFDLKLIRHNMDVSDPELKKYITDLLHPWKGGKENLKYINACCIFFEWELLNDLCLCDGDGEEIEKRLISEYKKEIERIVDIVKNKVASKNMHELRFHFFFIPVPSASTFRENFLKMLGFKGDEHGN